jgi:RHS repeat-associated protein
MGGLMDYRARFFSPHLGRFLQPDSIVPEPLNPQALNRYSYVLGNPIKFIDPSGHGVDCGIGTGCVRDPDPTPVTPPIVPPQQNPNGGGNLFKNDGHNLDCALFDRLCRKMVDAEKTADKDFRAYL